MFRLPIPFRVGALLAALTPLLLAGCARDRGPHPELPFIGVAVEYTSHNLCSLGQTPAIKLYGAPGGAARYRVRITNVGVLSGPSWEVETPATGAVIAEGALGDVPNPCPSELQSYTYRYEVMALAGNSQPLGYGWNFINVQSLPRRVQIEGTQQSRPPRPDTNTVESLRPPYFIY